MQVVRALLFFMIAGNAFGQSIVTKTEATFPLGLQPLIRPDGTTVEAARGVWRATGYGYLAEITEKEVRLFNETKTMLWQQSDIDPSELLVSVSQGGEQARIATHKQVPPYIVDRLESMPTNAHKPDKWTPTKIYTVFADTMAEHYAFFEERSFDWQERVARIRPTVGDTTNASQLFEAMLESLEGLDDAHVQLGATIEGDLRQAALGLPATMKQGIELFKKQSEFADFEEYAERHVQRLQAGIANDILAGAPQQTCKQLTWGTTKNNVGYLFVAGMNDFSDAESLDGQLTELHEGMNEILTELAGTPAMIVDVSTNGGGRDVFSRAIASHFADTRRLAFTKGPLKAPHVQHEVYVEPFSNKKKAVVYTKPVYVVISDVTVSAAEIFVLCMKDRPHVTTVGSRTRGALSDVLSKTLPNGWAFGLSNEVYKDSQGVCFEGQGIPPQIEMKVLDPTKPDLGHSSVIARVAALAKEQP